ncbi:MAG: rod shape-determining protein RodA [Lachnospiraceae bacterium]|nr:rod shape-determining protein RodA [Lachnospiraceae bacterium]
MNYRLLILVLGLTILGINIIGSADGSGTMKKQMLGMSLGLFATIVFIIFDYKFVLKFYWLIYAFMLVLLILVRVMGTEGYGATRWIVITDGVTIQPSEFAKLFIILFFAKFIMKHKEKLNTLKIILACVFLLAIPLGLIFIQPDLSTSILIALLFCSIMFIGGINYKVVFSVIGIGMVAAVVVLYLVLQPEQKILRGYQLKRIIAFYDKDSEYSDDLLMQQENSVMAIGSGGLWGKGLYNDDPNSIKNGNYLPADHTDFIYAIVGEDLGFVGCLIVVVLLFLIVVECFITGLRAPDLSGKIICCGFGSLIAFQAFINLSVVTMLIPNTGLTLPFVSYGLSSLISLYAGVGFILNISLQKVKN